MSVPPERRSTPAVEQAGSAAVLIVVSDSAQRRAIVEACQAARVSVRAASRIAEVKRWPVGEVVITDVANLTPWWQNVGAREVIVLAGNAEEGLLALQKGATVWVDMATADPAVAAMHAGVSAPPM